MKVLLYAKNQYNNSTLSGDTGDLLFPNTMKGCAWACLTIFNMNYVIKRYLT